VTHPDPGIPTALVSDPATLEPALAELLASAVTSTRDVVAGCGQMFDAAADDQLRHMGQAPLTDAIAGASKRDVSGGGWAWSRKNSSVDITPLVAATNALWGAGTAQPIDYDVMQSVY
jgi:hypothetical protein